MTPNPTAASVPRMEVPSSPSRKLGVYQCIVDVSRELASIGISKSRSNTQQGYKFRGIDEVLNVLAPLLARHGLVILPRMLNRLLVERQAKSGGTLFSVTVEAEFDFVCAADGSVHTVKMFGEAMDSADKATNKAMSAAYKYAAFQTFCIPTEGDNDADATTHEVVEHAVRAIGAAVFLAPAATVQPGRPTGVLITKVDETSIKSTGKPKWYVHFDDGNKASTIDTRLAAEARQCCGTTQRVRVELDKTQWGYNLQRISREIQLHDDAPASRRTDDDIPF